jgi:hypothetical protein
LLAASLTSLKKNKKFTHPGEVRTPDFNGLIEKNPYHNRVGSIAKID